MISRPHEHYAGFLQLSGNIERPQMVQAHTHNSLNTRAGVGCSPQTYSRPYRGVISPIRGGTVCSARQILPLLISLLTAVQAASALNFNNPSIPAQELCSTVTFSWSGGTPNFELQIIDANTQSVVEDFTGIAGNSLEWVADGKVEGRNVIAKVMDAAGESAVTELIPVSPGSPNACGPRVGAASTSTSTTSSPLSPPSTATPPSPKPSTSSSQTTVATTSTSLRPLPPQTSTSSLQSTTSKPLSPPPGTTSAPDKSSSSSSLPSSTPGSTSISSTSTTSASSTGLAQPSSSPISAPSQTQSQAVPWSPSISTSSSSSSPPSPSSTAPGKTATPSLSPGAKAAIVTTIIAFIVALGALAFWIHRRAARSRWVVRSSGERADLQETCPLLSEPDVPGRAVIAQRAWAGSSPPWLPKQPSTFTPADEDDVLVIQRRRTPRSMDAQASGWQSDFAPATTTSAGHPSLLSTVTATTARADRPEDRFTDSPIDPLLFSGDSTRPSSGCLPSTRPMGDLASLYAMLEADAASHRREGRLTGTDIDSAVDTASEEWDVDQLSDTRTIATLPPPYRHHKT